MDLYSTKDMQFCGIPIRQTWGDLFVLNYFLGSGAFENIIEVGTDQGGLSYFLSMYCEKLWTLDIEDKRTKKVKEKENIDFWVVDCLKKEKVDYFMLDSGLITPIPKFFFIDNGNKPLEFELFAPYLGKDDLIFLHEFNSEFMYKDIQKVVEEQKFDVMWKRGCGSMLIGFGKS